MRYFEIEFDNKPRDPDADDSVTIGEYSICILGERKPSMAEAAEFCKGDMEHLGYKYVVNVVEIDKTEAETFFDMEKADTFPIFR